MFVDLDNELIGEIKEAEPAWESAVGLDRLCCWYTYGLNDFCSFGSLLAMGDTPIEGVLIEGPPLSPWTGPGFEDMLAVDREVVAIKTIVDTESWKRPRLSSGVTSGGGVPRH